MKDKTTLDCKNCYGKGYSTVLRQDNWSTDMPDTAPMKRYQGKPYKAIEFCPKCERGKELKTHFDIHAQEVAAAALENLKDTLGQQDLRFDTNYAVHVIERPEMVRLIDQALAETKELK